MSSNNWEQSRGNGSRSHNQRERSSRTWEAEIRRHWGNTETTDSTGDVTQPERQVNSQTYTTKGQNLSDNQPTRRSNVDSKRDPSS
ncbi:hypothetical protein HOLleu_27452 [Holothuria leucospilota]|uniref:Uncharacterized protein n=1 Tax=Holothuria leucospilota TaxID=206669 RepID=A0A9Q1BQF0_HOLLE|nr:hypothetical protein HOLleu_27452 [Holothuria leucospilota]